MTKKQTTAQLKRTRATKSAGRKFPARAIGWAILAAVVALGLWLVRSKLADPPAADQPAQTNILQGTAAAVASTPEFELQKLVGRWLRQDGGYVLEISSVDARGKMEAAYFNPRPIHVARAEVSRDGIATKIFVELRDVNYPGSTYTLIYEPTNDQLKGIYFQAALKQQFEVFFQRLDR